MSWFYASSQQLFCGSAQFWLNTPFSPARTDDLPGLFSTSYNDLTHEQKEKVKQSVGNGPADWTGIDPNHNVITSDPNGFAHIMDHMRNLHPAVEEGDIMNEYTFCITLRTFSKVIDPDELCQRLAMNPTKKWKMGERFTTSDGTLTGDVRWWDNFCAFEIPPEDGETDINHSLNRIADRLSAHIELFRRIREGGGRVEFYVGWFINTNAGAVLEIELLQKLAALHLDLAFDVYSETSSNA